MKKVDLIIEQYLLSHEMQLNEQTNDDLVRFLMRDFSNLTNKQKASIIRTNIVNAEAEIGRKLTPQEVNQVRTGEITLQELIALHKRNVAFKKTGGSNIFSKLGKKIGSGLNQYNSYLSSMPTVKT